MDKLFKGRKIIIATKHQKEKVMTPYLKKELGLECIVSPDLDTDVFGTFTGEVERLNDPVQTARLKCLKAMEISGCDMAIANEGSFGLHPTMFFAHADSEIILLIDKKNNLEFVVREISTKTNFNGSVVHSYNELQAFAKSALFPSHALILRKSKTSKEDIYKGIKSVKELKLIYQELHTKYDSVYVETDMRAMYNPTRMEVIKHAMQKLVAKIQHQCPNCSAPGYSITEAKQGLPCENCGTPTRSTLIHIYQCKTCGFEEEKKYPHGRKSEDPMYCDICNP